MKALCWYGKEDVRVSLDEGPKMYKTFRDKQDGCIKVVLKPQAV
jgi:threonine dehydrogenase-like Zn-dependent dehydrogenase